MMKSKILITGGAGFIGSEFTRQAVRRGYKVVIADKLTYAGDLARLDDVKDKVKFYQADVCDRSAVEKIFAGEKPEIVVHFAAETHVDRSILDGTAFLETNIKGTQVMMDISRTFDVKQFCHISTDEVYGDIEKGKFKESSLIKPNSPYAASKAGADLLVQAYVRTYGFPALIVRASNNYGPWQYPEKFVPVIIAKALANEQVPVYGRGLNSREWLHVSDCAEGIFTVLERGKVGEVYNLGSGCERTNIELAKKLIKILGKSEKLIVFVKDRPGHDFRYALNVDKLNKLGWFPRVDFNCGIKKTVDWYKLHKQWVGRKASELGSYWKKVYRSK